MKLNLNAKGFGFYGMFNDLFASLFTVYLAASEEGWVYVLYDCMDALPSYLSVIYFLSMIFFFAWLVKVKDIVLGNKYLCSRKKQIYSRTCSSP